MELPLVRLDKLYNIARGGSPRPIKNFITDDPDGINWIKIGDATASGKYIYETKQKIIPEGIQRSRFVNEGDFILSNSMSFGRPYIMGTSGCIHDGWLVLSAKDNSVDQDFLYYILGSPFVFKQFDALAAGSTVRNLNIDLVSGVKIPLLPINEQKRIVAILEQAFSDIDNARANAEQNLKNARELFESYLQKIPDEKKPLGDFVSITTGKLNSNAAIEGGRYPFFTCSRDIFAIDSFSFDCEAILLAGNNASGDFNVKHYTGKFDAYQRTYVITINDTNQYIYGFLYFQMLKSLKELKESSVGVGTKFLKLGMIKDLKISAPPVDVQNQVLVVLDSLKNDIEKIEIVYKRKLKALDELKKSILQKAFTGELNKETKVSNVIPFPVSISGISTTDLHAGIIAIAYQQHEDAGKTKQLGHVKAEKIAHMVEAMVGIDLDRNPVQDAAGPNDYPRFKKKVEPRAKKAGYFEFKGSKEKGYVLVKRGKFSNLVEKTRKVLSESGCFSDLENLIQIMVKMDTEKTEIFATVYAAWNNLLLDKAEITDEAIVFAARENWHESKLNIARERFFKAIEWIRSQNLEPAGRGKYVN